MIGFPHTAHVSVIVAIRLWKEWFVVPVLATPTQNIEAVMSRLRTVAQPTFYGMPRTAIMGSCDPRYGYRIIHFAMEDQVQPANKGPVYTTKDRQWDARFLSLDEHSDNAIVAAAKQLAEQGRFRYVLVGGPEVGTNPRQDDYCQRHVHLALYYENPVTRKTILGHFGISKHYYLCPRNRSLPFSGWRDHHTKVLTKVDPSVFKLYEHGDLPSDDARKFTLRSNEEKKRKVDEVIRDIHEMLKRQEKEEAIFDKYPRNWMLYGEKIKAMMVQRKDFFKTNGDPHIWLWGVPGSGKSALIDYIYPNKYKKNLYNRFFDRYDPDQNDHILLEDLDHAACETLGLNFIKTLCDESGFTFDQKYKAVQTARSVILVTSQFTIGNILAGQEKQIEIESQGRAIRRRFWEINVRELHRILGIKLRTKYELNMLKQEGNQDPGKCFLAWDYADDMPALTEMPTPEQCQQKIRDAYYSA